MTHSGATTIGQGGPGGDDNEEEHDIPQSLNITGASQSDFLLSYPEHSFERPYPSAKKQSLYSTTPTDGAMVRFGLIYLFNRIPNLYLMLKPDLLVSNWFHIFLSKRNNSIFEVFQSNKDNLHKSIRFRITDNNIP